MLTQTPEYNAPTRQFLELQKATWKACEYLSATLCLEKRKEATRFIGWANEMIEHGLHSYDNECLNMLQQKPLSLTRPQALSVMYGYYLATPAQRKDLEKRMESPQIPYGDIESKRYYVYWKRNVNNMVRLGDKLQRGLLSFTTANPVLSHLQTLTESSRQQVIETLQKAPEITQKMTVSQGMYWLSGQLLNIVINDLSPKKKIGPDIDRLSQNIDWFSWSALVMDRFARTHLLSAINKNHFIRSRHLFIRHLFNEDAHCCCRL